MKKLLLLPLLALLTSPLFGEGINFRDLSINDAVAQANLENKYVFINVYAVWCAPCRMMKAQVFPEQEAGDWFNPRFVSLSIDAERGPCADTAFIRSLGVRAFPSFIILDGNGELVHLFAGGQLVVANFINQVNVAFDETRAFGRLQKRYLAGEREPRFLATYIQALAGTHTAHARVVEMINTFFTTESKEDKITPEALFMFDDFARLGSEKDIFLTENRERFREVAGREVVDEVFRRKYVAYFGQVIGGQAHATIEDIDRNAERFASLNIENALIPVFIQAARARLTGEGATALFERIEATIPTVEDSRERDVFLFFTIPGLREQWSQKQRETLIALVSDEQTKRHITRSIDRWLETQN